MKRMNRDRHLSPEEAEKYNGIREKVDRELPEILKRNEERISKVDQLLELLSQLKTARETKGLSLADLSGLTGMDRSALSRLETGQRENPTLDTLVRYADAVGKRIEITLKEAQQ